MTDQVVDALRRAAGDLGQVSRDAESDGPYTVVGEVARNLVGAIAQGSTAVFPDVFGAVEQNLEVATPEVRDLLVVGFLEDLQNISMNSGLSLDQWTAWLGPRTSESWETLKAMWAGELTPDVFNEFIRTGRRPT